MALQSAVSENESVYLNVMNEDIGKLGQLNFVHGYLKVAEIWIWLSHFRFDYLG